MTHTCTTHPPGAYACYSRHACKCDPCRTTGAQTQKLNRHRRATNTRTYVDSEPARRHVERLLAAGMGRAEVARLAAVEPITLTRLLRGDYRRLRGDGAARLIAVRPPLVVDQATGLVHSCGLTRRVEALAVLGWPIRDTMIAAGLNPNTYSHALATGRCQAGSRAAVARVHEAWWNGRPPEGQAAKWVRSRAATLGYLPSLAWDDGYGPHGIDNPNATPHDCVRRPERHTISSTDRIEAIENGATLADLIAQGQTPAAIQQALHRAGRPDLWLHIRPHRNGADPWKEAA